MASELRVNSSTNRSGLGTITYTDSGPIVSGVGTFANGLTVDGTQTTVKSLKLTGDNYNVNWFKTSSVFRLNDNAKLNLGSADDMQQYHDGTTSWIKNTTGVLRIENTVSNIGLYASHSSGDIIMRAGGATSSENAIVAVSHGEVTLAFNGSTKLTTTNTGVTVTGTAVADALDISGNVGINSTVPRGKLDIGFAGAPNFITFGSDADNPKVEFFRSTGGSPSHYATEIQQILGDLVLSTAATANLGSHSYEEKLRINSGGRVIIGHSQASGDLHGPQGTTGRNPFIQLHGANTSSAGLGLISWKNSAGAYYAPTLYLAHSGSDTKGTNGILPTNGEFGSIVFSGDDGTDFVKGAMIKARLDGTPGDNDMPGMLQFYTTPDGSDSPTERLRITSDGNITFGSQTGSAVAVTSSAIKNLKLGSDYWNGTKGDYRAIREHIFYVNANDLYGFGISLNMLEIQSQQDIGFFAGTSGGGTGRREERLRIDSSGRVLIGGGSSPTQVGDARLLVYSDSRLHPAIKADCIDGGVNRANGYTIISDNYAGDESQVNLGVSYSSSGLVLSRGVKVSNAADDTYLSSQDSYAMRPCAIKLDDMGAFSFLTTETNATTTTDSAVSLTEVFKIDRVGNIYQRTSARNMYFGASNQLRIGVQGNGDPNIEAVSGNLKIMDSGNTIMQLRDDGFEMKQDIYFGTAGKGIVLGNTSNVDANTLDDYEEGSWTPALQNGSGSFHVHSAVYTKIGRQVGIQFYLTLSNAGSNTNQVQITGLPFPVRAGGWTASKVSTGYNNSGIHCRAEQSTSRIDIKGPADGAVTFANINGTWILSSFIYFTDS